MNPAMTQTMPQFTNMNTYTDDLERMYPETYRVIYEIRPTKLPIGCGTRYIPVSSTQYQDIEYHELINTYLEDIENYLMMKPNCSKNYTNKCNFERGESYKPTQVIDKLLKNEANLTNIFIK